MHVHRIWKRYIDDTFCILKKGAVEELLSHFNSLRPTILFTVEIERDGSLPFLDTLLQRKEDGSLSVTVYRKPMPTARYLDFQSHHPHHIKRGLVRCLYDRAKNNTNSQDNLVQEEHHITTVLKQNGYPNAFIHSSTWPQPTRDAEDREVEQKGNDTQRPPVVLLPYVSGVSEDIKRVCRGLGLRVIFKSRRSLRSVLTKVKDTLQQGNRGDDQEASDKDEGTPRGLLQGNAGEVSHGRTRLDTPPPH